MTGSHGIVAVVAGAEGGAGSTRLLEVLPDQFGADDMAIGHDRLPFALAGREPGTAGHHPGRASPQDRQHQHHFETILVAATYSAPYASLSKPRPVDEPDTGEGRNETPTP